MLPSKPDYEGWQRLAHSKPLDTSEQVTLTDEKRGEIITLIDTIVGDAVRNCGPWEDGHSAYLARTIWSILRR